jgi:hypothetical protein
LIGDDLFARDELSGGTGKDSSGSSFVPTLFRSLCDQYKNHFAAQNGKTLDKKAQTQLPGAPHNI